MINIKLTNSEYVEKLDSTVKEVYKVLLMYERYKNNTVSKKMVMDYINKTASYILAFKQTLENHNYSIWYVDTMLSLMIIEFIINEEADNHSTIRKYILDTTNLISTEISRLKNDNLKGE